MVSSIVNEVIAPYRATQGQLRPSMLPNYRHALEPFLADLLSAAALGRWSKLETNTDALNRHPGGMTAFKTMRNAMGASGLLEELPGYKRTYEAFDTPQVRYSRTSFRPSAALLKFAEGYGVSLRGLPNHFKASRAAPPDSVEVIEARAAKVNKSDRPRAVPVFPQGPKATKIIADMQRLNAFLMEDGRIEGIVFAGLRRVFTNADLPGFDWQWHGRFYSMPGADQYEHMEGGTSARIGAIRIDGSTVAEVDVSASQLTVLHGLLGMPFDPSSDPYALPGLSRDRVKDWMKRALGASDPEVGGRHFEAERTAGLQRYPFLADLKALGISTHALSFHEAEIMWLAMEGLMAEGIGFLPVHDALMVPQSKQGEAVQTMRAAFKDYFKNHLRMSRAPVPRVN